MSRGTQHAAARLQLPWAVRGYWRERFSHRQSVTLPGTNLPNAGNRVPSLDSSPSTLRTCALSIPPMKSENATALLQRARSQHLAVQENAGNTTSTPKDSFPRLPDTTDKEGASLIPPGGEGRTLLICSQHSPRLCREWGWLPLRDTFMSFMVKAFESPFAPLRDGFGPHVTDLSAVKLRQAGKLRRYASLCDLCGERS